MHAWRTSFALAQTQAQSARFPEMQATCQQIVAAYSDDVDALLDVGALLLNFGYLSRACACFERVRVLAPNDLRPIANLANLARKNGVSSNIPTFHEAYTDSAMHPFLENPKKKAWMT